MVDHPTTTIFIDLKRKDDESIPAISITGSLKSTVLTSQKKISHFFHKAKNLLYRISPYQTIKRQPNKKKILKTKKVTQYLEADI